MKKSRKITIGAMVSALSVVLMLITGLLPFLTYASPALAGILLVFIVLEINKKWAFLVYICISILSFLICPDRSASIAFIVFFGYYPILKGIIEQMKNGTVEWLIKIVIFNVALAIGLVISAAIIGIEYAFEEYYTFGIYGVIVLVIVANGAFVVFDIALTRIISGIINFFIPKYLSKLK